MTDHLAEFSDRLNEALEKKGLPVRGRATELANYFKITPKAAGKWINGEALPDTKRIIDLSKWLGVGVEWLLTGQDVPVKLDNNVDLSQKIPLEGRPVPVISWVAAGSFDSIETILKDTKVDEHLPPLRECGKNGYGLIVVGNSMKPEFKPGDRIYVNPDIQTFDLKTDDLVIIACSGDTEATFKKLIIEGGDKYLQPLNPNWPEQIIKLTEDCRLVGKVVGLHRKF